jgi:ribosome maturation factor RimP
MIPCLLSVTKSFLDLLSNFVSLESCPELHPKLRPELLPQRKNPKKKTLALQIESPGIARMISPLSDGSYIRPTFPKPVADIFTIANL